jgi:hypothetical protein
MFFLIGALENVNAWEAIKAMHDCGQAGRQHSLFS